MTSGSLGAAYESQATFWIDGPHWKSNSNRGGCISKLQCHRLSKVCLRVYIKRSRIANRSALTPLAGNDGPPGCLLGISKSQESFPGFFPTARKSVFISVLAAQAPPVLRIISKTLIPFKPCLLWVTKSLCLMGLHGLWMLGRNMPF